MKRLLSVLLCICMVMTLIPAMAMAASDTVYVGGYGMGDGSIPTYYRNDGEEGSEQYYNAKLYDDNGTLTLVLNGFEYEGTERGVDSDVKLKIVLEGANVITSTEDYGIRCDRDLDIVGTDGSTLNVTSTNVNAIMAYDDYMGYNESITITNADITATAGGDVGIVAPEALIISGSVINVTGCDYGLQGGGFNDDSDTNITVVDSTITATATDSDGAAFRSVPNGDYQWRDSDSGEWIDGINSTGFLDAKYIELKPVSSNGGDSSTPADLPDTVNEKGPAEIEICSFKLTDGDYLASNDATEVSENYENGTPYVAVYKNGILYLNGLCAENNASNKHSLYWEYDFMGKHDLVIELIEGSTNTLVDTNNSSVEGNSGTGSGPSGIIQGNGTLNITGKSFGFWVWHKITIQNGATVNATGVETAGFSNNTRGGGLVIRPGTNVTISGGNYGVMTDHRGFGTFYVEGGTITVKGNESAIKDINCDFGDIPVYVSENVSGEGATLWDGTTALTNYKYITLSGTRTEAPGTYTVSFDANGGEGTMEEQEIILGEATALSANEFTRDGYTFLGWAEEIDGEVVYADEEEVTDLAASGESIILYAVWEEVSNNNNNKGHYGGLQAGGDTSRTGADKLGASDDNESKPEVKPDDSVSDGETTTRPSAKFADLSASAWYNEDVNYVLEKGLFNGTTATTFSPNGKLTRAMLVTVLYRAAGEPATNRSIPFGDVDMGAYYANAVSWAQQNRIVTGVSETKFAPDENITREQIATILFRYASYNGKNMEVKEEALSFADASSVSDYALAAMTWNIKNGFVQGRSGNKLAPREFATRAEAAALLHRFLEAK